MAQSCSSETLVFLPSSSTTSPLLKMFARLRGKGGAKATTSPPLPVTLCAPETQGAAADKPAPVEQTAPADQPESGAEVIANTETKTSEEANADATEEVSQAAVGTVDQP